jgi:NAD(P)-dependent dehydrogenase (short-subunit alcohol dehydrogenase family)
VPAFQVDLGGQAAIVTGAGGGIGRAIALALGRSGAAVAAGDLSPDHADRTAQAIVDAGGRAFGYQGDPSNRFQAAALIEEARAQFGRIHILINALGAYKTGDFARIDEWDWRRQIDLNLTAAFFCTQLLGRVMADEGGGVMINIAASVGTLPTGAGFMAARAGLIGLTRQAARELAPAGIRVNALCPAHIDSAAPALPPPTAHNFLGRAGSVDEVAAAALFLCSDAASFITGQAIAVDGGALGD